MAWSRCCDTRRRKSELTGNTNFDLNRRASLRPYQLGPQDAIFGGEVFFGNLARDISNITGEVTERATKAMDGDAGLQAL